MSDLYTVELTAPGPWGFRLQGGKDFSMPLTISRLTDNSKAAKAGVAVGDAVISIGDLKTEELNHLEAQSKIKECKGNLKLSLQRADSVPKPAAPPKTTTVTTTINATVPKPPLNRVMRKPIIQTDIGFYHEASHADASRKRIMEDTEDWRPRTGTSQSRSFHILAQITGTEALPENMDSNKNTVKVMKKIQVGPRYHKLRDWHHGVSAQTLNVLSLV
ncbi:PDZ and LIM domain protein 5a [Neoarius graeffei]|uniref:PDZ and LIM domain protein 5a n=1 Tax=Neoarius graeffei TaxID=443677 RepID=UPI00298C89E7|nr:PDZ and LIM domain protein 5a [Neoarius graeffei]